MGGPRSFLVLTLLVPGCVVRFPGGVTLAGVRLDHQAERREVHALALASEEVLTLVTTFGRVEVNAVEGAAPELHASVRAHGRTPVEAEAALARYALVLSRGAGGTRAELGGEPLRVHAGQRHLELGAQVDFVATVAPGTSLVATSGSGDLVTRGALGALRLDSSFGAIRIDEARGDVHAKSGSGDVEARRLAGAEAVLESGFGTLRVRAACARRVRCQSGSGDLVVDSFQGEELELDTGFGAVRVTAASGRVRARAGSGDVRLTGLRGAVEADSRYGQVEVEGVLEALAASSGSGDVRVTARAGSRVTGTWKASSSFGAVVLCAPEDFGCTPDARTGFGSVRTDFPVASEAGQRRSERHLRGTVGSGGGTVELSAGSGDVALVRP